MGSNPAIPTTGTGVRAVAVLGADTEVGAAIFVALADSGFDVTPVLDGDPLPADARAVIDAGALREPSDLGDLASLSPDAWLRTTEEPLRRALHVLQAAHHCLRDGGGRIVVLLPSLVMTGAADAAGWVAAAEGYRALTKSAARAWGADGITIQCVLVSAEAVSDRPGLQAPALSRTPDPRSEIGPAVTALLDERLDVVTGVTLALDGGVWMTS